MNKKLLMTFLLCAGSIWAQDEPERATVPLTDPARPARIRVQLMAGGVKVRGADVKQVVVEARGRHESESREHRPERADGLKRLNLPSNPGLDVMEENNEVTIKTTMSRGPSDLIVTVPRRSSLQLKCMNDGDIEVEQVEGEIDANDLNGRITLKNVGGSVVAHSLNGSVTVVLDRVDASKPMSFSTMNGDIDVTLPENLKANVRVKADHGEVYSDFDVKMDASRPTRQDSGRQSDGTYHLRFDQTLRGTINGGGPELQFTSFNGQIFIRKKK